MALQKGRFRVGTLSKCALNIVAELLQNGYTPAYVYMQELINALSNNMYYCRSHTTKTNVIAGFPIAA